MNESAEDLRRIVELRTRAIRARRLADDATEAAKAAKEAAKEAETELVMFIDELRNPPPLFGDRRGDRLDDLNDEILAGVRETEQARDDEDEPGEGKPGATSWRDVPIRELGLDDGTLDVLRSHDVRLVGQLAGLCAEDDGNGPRFLDDDQMLDAHNALVRFRNRRSNAEIPDIDAMMAGRAAALPAAPARGRKAVAS